ncbi:MAG TPA: protease pro-enzyme activation domain-containing protein [Verrucomicrobiae bacterium]
MKTEAFSAARWTLAIAVAVAMSTSARAQSAGVPAIALVTAGQQVLQNSRPAAISHLSASGRLPTDTRLNLSVGLPLRNESALDTLLGQLYDPASPNYRHYLTRQQFIEQFAPSATDYQTVANFFGTNGFTVVQHPDRMVLDVSASSANVERVFHLTMRNWQHPAEPRTFFAPDRAPSLDLNVPILHISGLDNYAIKKSKIIKETAAKPSASNSGQAKSPRQSGSGSGPDGGYMGNDFRAAYIPGVSLTGTGQTVGLLEYDGFYQSDITTYEGLAGVSVPETIVPVDGGVDSPGDGDDEVSLDIEVAMSVAPGLSQIVVYEAPGTASWEDILDAMANDTVNSPKQFSCSWGDSSPDVPNVTAENIFKQMEAQGQSFYDAAGDGDSFYGGIPFPAESTNIVEVGGTTVTTTGPGGPSISETVWNWGGNALGDSSIGGSGGISENYSIPPWQQGINMAANDGSTTMRNVPDVAMTADNVFVEYDQGTQDTFGGTSCAAPAWAAFTALANQQAAADGKPSVGFAVPAIYAAAKSASYLSDFNDITTGNNFWAFMVTNFPAVPGYDLCTGWGTPVGDNLIDLLAGTGDSLAVAPGKGFVAFGPSGGGFSANTETFSLTNSSSSSLNWSVFNPAFWLTPSSAGGTLAAHAATQVTVSLNSLANFLPAANYYAGILFSNQTTHTARTREFVLEAGQNLVQNGDFENYPYALPDWAQTGGIGMFNETPYPTFNNDFVDDGTVTFSYSAYSGTMFCVFATAGATGYISQNIATVPGQTYELSFYLMNAASGPNQDFLVNWNPDNGTTNTVYKLINPDAFDWSNVTLPLTATSTNMVLQFGGRADQTATSDYSEFGIPANLFGLDDVTLIPLASSPNQNIIAKITQATPGNVALTWNSVFGKMYYVQYSASLLPANWINISTNTASGSTITLTNSIGSNPQGYYRIVLP